MKSIPSSIARRSTRRDSSGLFGSPQMPGPVRRMAPKPIRLTVNPVSRVIVPAAPAGVPLYSTMVLLYLGPLPGRLQVEPIDESDEAPVRVGHECAVVPAFRHQFHHLRRRHARPMGGRTVLHSLPHAGMRMLLNGATAHPTQHHQVLVDHRTPVPAFAHSLRKVGQPLVQTAGRRIPVSDITYRRLVGR